jgi:DNA-binding SARP family transcriptional activator
MNAPWRIEMLGWLRATHADRVIERFRSRKSSALLAYLAYRPHHSHPREVLIELLWPETPWKRGRTSLRTELSWLRRRLEPPGVPVGTVLLSEGDTVRLNPATCDTDVAAFETALRAAEAGARADRVQRLTEAVTLYRGELLPGHFEAWVLPERLRLAEAFLGAMHELAAAREAAGDLSGALQLAWQAACVDPLRDQTHADLIRLLVATGQREAARRQCREREQLLEPEPQGPEQPSLERRSSVPERVGEQSPRVHAAEAEELRRQLARRTAEAEDLRQRLLTERAETRRLRRELAVRSSGVGAPGWQEEPAAPGPRGGSRAE